MHEQDLQARKRAHIEGALEAVLGAKHKGADEAVQDGHNDAVQEG
jgi:hypothetical protein